MSTPLRIHNHPHRQETPARLSTLPHTPSHSTTYGWVLEQQQQWWGWWLWMDGRKEGRKEGRKDGWMVVWLSGRAGGHPCSFAFLHSCPPPLPSVSTHMPLLLPHKMPHDLLRLRSWNNGQDSSFPPRHVFSFHAQGSSPWEIQFCWSNYTHTHTSFDKRGKDREGQGELEATHIHTRIA